MSDMGINPGAGGIGGPGGIQPGQGPGGIQDVGDAKESDVAQFQQALGAEGPAQANPAQEANSPFDVQANRITDSNAVGGMEAKGGVGDAVLGDISKMLNAGRAQESALLEKLESVGEKGWGPEDALEFQYMAGEMQMMTEVISKGVNKTVQAIQTTARNQ